MKKILLSLFFMSVGIALHAQSATEADSSTKKQVTRFNIGKMRVTIEEDPDSLPAVAVRPDSASKQSAVVIQMAGDSAAKSVAVPAKRKFFIPDYWGGLCIGTNGYLNASGSTAMPTGYEYLELTQGKSVAVALNLQGLRLNLYEKKLHLVTGIGFEWNNYRFTNDFTLFTDTNRVSAYTSGRNYSKNKLTASYVTLPVLIGFNTNPRTRKHFYVATGFICALHLSAHAKQVYDLNGQAYKSKVQDDFNIEPFRYDATLRIGYRHAMLFANYSISKLFRLGRGPELHPFSVGIRLI